MEVRDPQKLKRCFDGTGDLLSQSLQVDQKLGSGRQDREKSGHHFAEAAYSYGVLLATTASRYRA